MKNKLIYLFVTIFLFGAIVSPIWANQDTGLEHKNEKYYITEDTTVGDVVKATNPDYDEIPDEVIERMNNQYILEERTKTKDSSIAIYAASSFLDTLKIFSGVLIVAILSLIYLWWYRRKK